MTTTTLDSRRVRDVAFARVVRSEWIKLRSLSSSFVLLSSSAAAMIAVGALGAGGVILAVQSDHPVTEQSVLAMPTSGLSFGQLLLGALAVLMISSEYGTGMIRSSIAAVPQRIPVLLAKAVVVAVVGYITGTAAAFVTAVLIQPILAQEDLQFGLDESGVTGSLLLTGLYLALVGVLALAVGTLLRHSAGAIVALIGLLFVLPTALSMIPGETAANILKYLPSEAGARMLATETVGEQLTQWQGALVLGAWAVLPFIAALLVLRRRDV
jgi:ABC-2 type transport system permease protein